MRSRARCLALVALASGWWCGPAFGGRPGAGPEFERVVDGVRYARLAKADPRPLEIHVLEVDLASGRVALEAAASGDPDGPGPAEATLVDPLRLVDRPDVVAAVNANAFRGLPGASGTAGKHWKLDMPVTIAGWARTPGGDASLPDCDFDQFWVDAAGGARIGRADDAGRHRATTAVAGFHVILSNGRPVIGYREKLHPRTAVGTDASRRTVWLVVVDGRRPDVSEGMTYRELAALMRDLGCVTALNLDGGGSTVMLKAGAAGDLEIVNRPSGGTPRPVPVMLTVTTAVREPAPATR